MVPTGMNAEEHIVLGVNPDEWENWKDETIQGQK